MTRTRTRTSDPAGRPAGRPPRKQSPAPASTARDRLVRLPEEERDGADLVAMGKLGRHWGTRGAITVRLHNPDSELEWLDEVVWLSADGFGPTAVQVDRWQDKSGKLLISLTGITSPQLARGLTHMELLVPGDWLPELEEGEEYVYQLIGMRVIDEERGELGRIAHVFETGANDVWVVQGGAQEELIPAVRDFVLDVDHDNRVVRVRWSLD